MKFTGEISKIDEQGVKAKEDNPIMQKDDLGDDLCDYCPLEKKGAYGVDGGYMAGCEGSKCNESYDNYLERYQEAEANRKEYDVKEIIKSNTLGELKSGESLYSSAHGSIPITDNGFFIRNKDEKVSVKLGLRIEGDIINNEIVNVKLI